MYIKVNDEKLYNEIVISAMVSPWLFRFPNNCHPTYKDAKKYYHGNSKLLIHLFYNGITKAYEMAVTTATTEKTYPHIKKLDIYNWNDVDYELVKGIFGNV